MSELNDQQRAQLLQLYKEKLQELGDDVFFNNFDSIREECHKQMGVSLEAIDNKAKKSLPYSSRLAGLLACSCADLHEGQHPFYGSTISPEDLATQISQAIQEVLTHKEESQSSKSSIPFYFDPVHLAASTLGRQGGKVKSESKSSSSRSNGKKGGRPKVNRLLDMDDI